MRPLQNYLPAGIHPDFLVGLDQPDDAAVWSISPDRAIVFTVDFFTPIVDTPYEFGAIAAANALSDVYAMGGDPILALNIAAFPPQLPADVTAEIIRGGAMKVTEAGAFLGGGHSVKDQELKYGMAVLGFVDPERMIRKSGARPGDRLFLTKPLGIGVITTALRQEQAEPDHVRTAVEWMMRLNRDLLPLARRLLVKGGTDITGFGLLGHAVEVAEASGVRIQLHLPSIPFLDGAAGYSRGGYIPGGSLSNEKYFQNRVSFPTYIAPEFRTLLFDAQTSGGLLLCVPETHVPAFQAGARETNIPVWEIGGITDGEGIQVLDSEI
jgi:selenide,water dikinase